MRESVLLVLLGTSASVNVFLLVLCWRWYRLTNRMMASRDKWANLLLRKYVAES